MRISIDIVPMQITQQMLSMISTFFFNHIKTPVIQKYNLDGSSKFHYQRHDYQQRRSRNQSRLDEPLEEKGKKISKCWAQCWADQKSARKKGLDFTSKPLFSFWSVRHDSNMRPSVPKTENYDFRHFLSTPTKFDYTPTSLNKYEENLPLTFLMCGVNYIYVRGMVRGRAPSPHSPS